MSMNTNSIWNFAEKHPFLFYSCVSSIVGGTVKIVRTLKGEPEPVSVTVSDAAADKVKTAVKDVVNKASDKLLGETSADAENEQGDDAHSNEKPYIPPEGVEDFCSFRVDDIARFIESASGYCELWGNIPLAEVLFYDVSSDHERVEPEAGDYDWGWTDEEFMNGYKILNIADNTGWILLPRPHKL